MVNIEILPRCSRVTNASSDKVRLPFAGALIRADVFKELSLAHDLQFAS